MTISSLRKQLIAVYVSKLISGGHDSNYQIAQIRKYFRGPEQKFALQSREATLKAVQEAQEVPQRVKRISRRVSTIRKKSPLLVKKTKNFRSTEDNLRKAVKILKSKKAKSKQKAVKLWNSEIDKLRQPERYTQAGYRTLRKIVREYKKVILPPVKKPVKKSTWTQTSAKDFDRAIYESLTGELLELSREKSSASLDRTIAGYSEQLQKLRKKRFIKVSYLDELISFVDTLAERERLKKLKRQPVKPFRLLTYNDLMEHFALTAIDTGEILTEEFFESVKFISRPADYTRFIRDISGIRQEQEDIGSEGWKPTLEVMESLEDRWGEGIKLGKLGAVWSQLLSYENPFDKNWRILSKTPSMSDIFHKGNLKSKKIYVFALMEWNAVSDNPTYNLTQGNLTVWGWEWHNKDGRNPAEYLSKVMSPSNLETEVQGPWKKKRYRKKSRLEDLMESRFTDSDIFQFKEFLGIYIPIKRKK